jgi:hypothetical protein
MVRRCQIGSQSARQRHLFATAIFLSFWASGFLIPGLVLASTTVSGLISVDTTWSLSGSPYIANSSVQFYGTSSIPITLSIETGVIVTFKPSTAMIISATVFPAVHSIERRYMP